jgi:hypothetical protein
VTNPITDQLPVWAPEPATEEDATARLDTAPLSTRRRTRESQETEAARKRLLLIIIAAVGVLLIGVAGFFIWRALSTEDKPLPPPVVEGRKPMTFYVSGASADYPSLSVLFDTPRLKSGDRVVVRAAAITDELHIKESQARVLKGISIEADETIPEVVWKPKRNSISAGALLEMNDVEGFTIKGFTFDGKGEAGLAKALIQLECGCRDVKIENVKLRNWADAGIKFTNCIATKEKPVIVSGAQFTDNPKPAILFELRPFYYNAYPGNEHITIRDDCTIPPAAAIQVQTVKQGDYAGITLPKGRQPQVIPVTFPKK